MSRGAKNIIAIMLKGLSSLKYGDKTVVEGAYIYAVENCHYPVPVESKDVIIAKVIEILKTI